MHFFDRFLGRGGSAALDNQRDPEVLLAIIQENTKPARERKRAILRLGELYAESNRRSAGTADSSVDVIRDFG